MAASEKVRVQRMCDLKGARGKCGCEERGRRRSGVRSEYELMR